jgi:hypothetical protein
LQTSGVGIPGLSNSEAATSNNNNNSGFSYAAVAAISVLSTLLVVAIIGGAAFVWWRRRRQRNNSNRNTWPQPDPSSNVMTSPVDQPPAPAATFVVSPSSESSSTSVNKVSQLVPFQGSTGRRTPVEIDNDERFEAPPGLVVGYYDQAGNGSGNGSSPVVAPGQQTGGGWQPPQHSRYPDGYGGSPVEMPVQRFT